MKNKKKCISNKKDTNPIHFYLGLFPEDKIIRMKKFNKFYRYKLLFRYFQIQAAAWFRRSQINKIIHDIFQSSIRIIVRIFIKLFLANFDYR